MDCGSKSLRKKIGFTRIFSFRMLFLFMHIHFSMVEHAVFTGIQAITQYCDPLNARKKINLQIKTLVYPINSALPAVADNLISLQNQPLDCLIHQANGSLEAAAKQASTHSKRIKLTLFHLSTLSSELKKHSRRRSSRPGIGTFG